MNTIFMNLYTLNTVRTLPVALLWCDLGFFPDSRGNKAAANLCPTQENLWLHICSTQNWDNSIILNTCHFIQRWITVQWCFKCAGRANTAVSFTRSISFMNIQTAAGALREYSFFASCFFLFFSSNSHSCLWFSEHSTSRWFCFWQGGSQQCWTVESASAESAPGRWSLALFPCSSCTSELSVNLSESFHYVPVLRIRTLHSEKAPCQKGKSLPHADRQLLERRWRPRWLQAPSS